jgi:sterol desaturase/sphingolipid hydroxylase (fatty acid hydroxylase superfamily)
MNTFYLLLLSITLLFCGLDFVLAKAGERRELALQWPLHGALYLAGQLANFVVPVSVFTASVLGTRLLGFGIGQRVEASSWLLACLGWGLSETLVVYILHRAEHKYRPLWAFHRIHHCDERMDASTAFRHHPAEDVITVLTIAPLAFLLTPSLSVLLAWFLVGVLIDLFNHSRLRLPDPLSTALEWIVITPRLHRVHHSPLANQTDSNFGGTFTFWDRIFGTYCSEVPAGQGLDDENLAGTKSRDFDTLVFEPFRFAWRSIRNR